MKSSTRNHVRKTGRAIIEACETRRMFVGFTIDGTNGPDAISISINGNDILWAVNGVSDSHLDALFNEVTINGSGGADTISIVETGSNAIIVNGGAGDDTINAGNGGNTLANIEDTLTINGDSGIDQAIFHDNFNAGNVTYIASLGNRLSSSQMPAATVNTENVEVDAGAGTSLMRFDDPPVADWLFHGGGGANTVLANGGASESVVYRTGGQSGGSGALDWANGSTSEFFFAPDLYTNGFGHVTVHTSFLGNDLTVASDLDSSTISGVSGTIVAPFAAFHVNDDVGICTIDTSAGENPTAADALRFTGDSDGATLFEVDLGGPGGGNSILVEGDHKIDTRVGFAGGQFNTITVDNATATFDGLQTPAHLILRDNATAAFVGAGAVLTTPDLQLPAGKGTINIPSGATGSVVSTFAIAANAELIKNGGGTFNSGATVVQSHAVNSTLSVDGGLFNMLNDAGSATARRLNAGSTGGTLVFDATQHLKSVFADGGTVRLSSHHDRVIVTEAIGVNTDVGGNIDLTDNQLILDYSGATPLVDVNNLLTGGFAGGAWNGIGLTSSTAAATPNTALGYAERTSVASTFPTTFAGETLDSTAVLVRFTLSGDTDLNRTVNFDDLVRLAQNYGPTVPGKQWLQGNFNYNIADTAKGAVGFVDLVALAQNYNLSMLSASPVSATTSTRHDRQLLES